MVSQANNTVRFTGCVADELKYSHRVYSENFYTFTLQVCRLSGNSDQIPVMISERLLAGDYPPGSRVTVEGQLRSYNIMRDGRSHLVLKVFVRSMENAQEGLPDENSVCLRGYLCKPPVYRTTPFCREISDMLIAANRAYGKSDYIPCICWGRNARFCRELEVAQYICLAGRLQSRIYEKHTEDGDIIQRTAYEVSVSKLSLTPEEEEEPPYFCAEEAGR